MGKVLSILIGLVLIVVGALGVKAWPADVLSFLKGALVIVVILIGLGIFVFGVSELRAASEEPPVVEPAGSRPEEKPSQ